MKQDILNQWLAALRSGEYKQGQGKLRVSEGFCCLGVLCDLYAKAHSNAEWHEVKHLDGANFLVKGEYGAFDEYDYLPIPVQQWAGVTEANPRVGAGYGQTRNVKVEQLTVGHEMRPLSELNDSGMSFEKIARLLELEFGVALKSTEN